MCLKIIEIGNTANFRCYECKARGVKRYKNKRYRNLEA